MVQYLAQQNLCYWGELFLSPTSVGGSSGVVVEVAGRAVLLPNKMVIPPFAATL